MEHIRHKPQTELVKDRGIAVLCPQFRSSVNLSRILRAAGCFGIRQVIAAGNTKIDETIARDSLTYVEFERRRSLQPVLKKLRDQGYRLVGLEQTDQSTSIFEFEFPWKTALVLGHERLGIPDEILAMLDVALEIPVFGQPHSYNVATAATIAMYEYCRQYPTG